jgi:hypothetical protein
MRFKGIVSKRRQSAYRSGPMRDWPKITTAAWRAANRDRWDSLSGKSLPARLLGLGGAAG